MALGLCNYDLESVFSENETDRRATLAAALIDTQV